MVGRLTQIGYRSMIYLSTRQGLVALSQHGCDVLFGNYLCLERPREVKHRASQDEVVGVRINGCVCVASAAGLFHYMDAAT